MADVLYGPEAMMPSDPLWEFSLGFYRKPGVAPACLRLQDEVGVDVNVLLFVLWCASTGRKLEATALRRADETVTVWRTTIVEPLRKLRREMKRDLLPHVETGSLREQLKSVEFGAERLEQAALLGLAPPRSDSEPPGSTKAYLDLYARHLGREFPSEPVRVLLEAAS